MLILGDVGVAGDTEALLARPGVADAAAAAGCTPRTFKPSVDGASEESHHVTSATTATAEVSGPGTAYSYLPSWPNFLTRFFGSSLCVRV